MQVVPLSLTSESDQRVYVDVYAVTARRQRDDAVANAGRPAQVAVDVHLDPGRRTRRVVGERRGGADDRTRRPGWTSVSMRGCGSTSIIVVIGFLDLGLGGRSCGD